MAILNLPIKTKILFVLGYALFVAGCAPEADCGNQQVKSGILELLSKNPDNHIYEEIQKTGNIQAIQELIDRQTLLANQFEGMRAHYKSKRDNASQKANANFGICHANLLKSLPESVIRKFRDVDNTTFYNSAQFLGAPLMQQICQSNDPYKLINELKNLDAAAEQWRKSVQAILKVTTELNEERTLANMAYEKSLKIRSDAMNEAELINATISKWIDAHKNVTYQLADIRTQSKNDATKAAICRATAIAKLENLSVSSNIIYSVEITTDNKFYLTVLGGAAR